MPAPTPTPYDPAFSFTAHQATAPSTPPPGGALDAEFNALRATTDSIALALDDVRRADGNVAAGKVNLQSLAPDALALLDGTTFNIRGGWVTATAYAKGDVVRHNTNGGTLLCAVAHTSGTLSADISAVKWLYLCPFGAGVYASAPAALVSDVGKFLRATGADAYEWASESQFFPIGGRQRLINADFVENQRAFVSGASLSAGAYGHDRWKAGSGGCTYSFTLAVPSTTISITAGTLQQVIEGAGLEGGLFYLSWLGTAQARVNGGSYQASPIAVSGLAAGTNVTVEFGTGTVLVPQFEPNGVTTYERLWPSIRLAACERFYRQVIVHVAGYSSAGGQNFSVPVTWPLMRAIPTATVVNAGTGVNSASATLDSLVRNGGRFTSQSSAAGSVSVSSRVYALDAEL